MAKTKIEHVDCFPKQNADASLPEAISVDEIRSEVTAGTEAVISIAGQCYSVDNAGTFTRNRKNVGRARLLEADLLKEFPASTTVTTFRDLRKAYEKARSVVRDAITPHAEYSDRGMDAPIIEAVAKTFVEICRKFHGKVAAALAANAQTTEEQAQKIRRSLLRQKVSDRLVSASANLRALESTPGFTAEENVFRDDVELLEAFLLCTEEAIGQASTTGIPLKRASIEEHLRGYSDGNGDHETLLSAWARELLPDAVSIPVLNGKEQTNGEIHFDARRLLMPRKLSCMQQRNKDPMGLPEWEMTASECDVLRQLIELKGQGRSESELAENDDFLSIAAQHINDRCSAGLALLRGPVEVKKKLELLAVPSAAPIEPTPQLVVQHKARAPELVIKKQPDIATPAPPPAPIVVQEETVVITQFAAAIEELPADAEPVITPVQSRAETPISLPTVHPLHSKKYSEWTVDMIYQFMDEVALEQKLQLFEAIKRTCKKFDVPSWKYDKWKREYPEERRPVAPPPAPPPPPPPELPEEQTVSAEPSDDEPVEPTKVKKKPLMTRKSLRFAVRQ